MKSRNYLFLALLILIIASCQNNVNNAQKPMQDNMKNDNADPEFKRICTERTPDNWMDMKPMMDGKLMEGDSCWGCMSDDGMSHFCSMEEYKEYLISVSG